MKLTFGLENLLMEEYDDSSGDSGVGYGVDGEAAAEPSFFIRDISEDDAYETLRNARDYPTQLSALESRLDERYSPFASQLEALQKALQTQSSFEPKFEKLAAVLEQYDPNLAKQFLPALEESLRESVKTHPLDMQALAPHINPYLNQMNEHYERQLALGLLDAFDIDVNSIIPPVEGNQWQPQTETHKNFVRWYSMQDGPTQKALSKPGLGFAQAMKRFKVWNSNLVKEKEGAADNASARLESSQQPRAAVRGRGPRRLETEEDGFMAAFKN